MKGLIVQRVRNLVLDVARADAFHTLALRFLAKLLHGVLRVAGQHLAVVELHLLQELQAVLLGLLQAGQDGPHGRDLERVRGHVLAAHLLLAEALFVDANLVG